jgi:hypothetical protein
MQYYKKELQGQARFLKYLSQYIKDKDESIDWLINLFLKFKGEADAENAGWYFGRWYKSLEEENEKEG